MSDVHYGDVLWVDLDPAAGHEQRKRRPVIVVSNDAYNRFNNLVMVVPITSDRAYPLHIDIGEIPVDGADGGTIRGWAEVEQLKSLDLASRGAVKVASLDDAALSCVTDMALGCLMHPSMRLERLD